MATIEELTAEVERLRVNLRASEMLRAMECQAVYQAIRQPGEKKPSRISVICALRGVTLPEDFLPAVDRIFIENKELREEANFYRELHNKTCPTVDKFVYGSCNCRLSVQIERNRSSADSGQSQS